MHDLCAFFRVSVLEASALRDLREKIIAMESFLVKEFQKCDPDDKGLA